MSDFSVKGPFGVPCVPLGNGRIVCKNDLGDFWTNVVGDDLPSRRGCYVFGIRAGKGITPVYVGQATKSFRQECFAPGKLHKLDQSLLLWKKGRLILFLVPLRKQKGPTNRRLIHRAETFLIQNAVTRNDKLLNIQGTQQESWGITGVLRGGKGKPSAAAMAFRRMMGL